MDQPGPSRAKGPDSTRQSNRRKRKMQLRAEPSDESDQPTESDTEDEAKPGVVKRSRPPRRRRRAAGAQSPEPAAQIDQDPEEQIEEAVPIAVPPPDCLGDCHNAVLFHLEPLPKEFVCPITPSNRVRFVTCPYSTKCRYHFFEHVFRVHKGRHNLLSKEECREFHNHFYTICHDCGKFDEKLESHLKVRQENHFHMMLIAKRHYKQLSFRNKKIAPVNEGFSSDDELPDPAIQDCEEKDKEYSIFKISDDFGWNEDNVLSFGLIYKDFTQLLPEYKGLHELHCFRKLQEHFIKFNLKYNLKRNRDLNEDVIQSRRHDLIFDGERSAILDKIHDWNFDTNEILVFFKFLTEKDRTPEEYLYQKVAFWIGLDELVDKSTRFGTGVANFIQDQFTLFSNGEQRNDLFDELINEVIRAGELIDEEEQVEELLNDEGKVEEPLNEDKNIEEEKLEVEERNEEDQNEGTNEERGSTPSDGSASSASVPNEESPNEQEVMDQQMTEHEEPSPVVDTSELVSQSTGSLKTHGPTSSAINSNEESNSRREIIEQQHVTEHDESSPVVDAAASVTSQSTSLLETHDLTGSSSMLSEDLQSRPGTSRQQTEPETEQRNEPETEQQTEPETEQQIEQQTELETEQQTEHAKSSPVGNAAAMAQPQSSPKPQDLSSDDGISSYQSQGSASSVISGQSTSQTSAPAQSDGDSLLLSDHSYNDGSSSVTEEFPAASSANQVPVMSSLVPSTESAPVRSPRPTAYKSFCESSNLHFENDDRPNSLPPARQIMSTSTSFLNLRCPIQRQQRDQQLQLEKEEERQRKLQQRQQQLDAQMPYGSVFRYFRGYTYSRFSCKRTGDSDYWANEGRQQLKHQRTLLSSTATGSSFNWSFIPMSVALSNGSQFQANIVETGASVSNVGSVRVPPMNPRSSNDDLDDTPQEGPSSGRDGGLVIAEEEEEEEEELPISREITNGNNHGDNMQQSSDNENETVVSASSNEQDSPQTEQEQIQSLAAALAQIKIDGTVEMANEQNDCSLLLDSLIGKVENGISDHSESINHTTVQANQNSSVDGIENKHPNPNTSTNEQNQVQMDKIESDTMQTSNERQCETHNVEKAKMSKHLDQHFAAVLAPMDIGGTVENSLANEEEDYSLILNSLIGQVENDISGQSVQNTMAANQNSSVDGLENMYPNANMNTTEKNDKQTEKDENDIVPTSNDRECKTQNVQKSQHLVQNLTDVLAPMEIVGTVENSLANKQDDCSLVLNGLIGQVENDISEMRLIEENHNNSVDSLENKCPNENTTTTEQNDKQLEKDENDIVPTSNDPQCEPQNMEKAEETQHLVQHFAADLAQMKIDGTVESSLANEKDDCSLVLNGLITRVENGVSGQSEMLSIIETNQHNTAGSLENKYPHENTINTEQNELEAIHDIMPKSNDPQCETQNVQKPEETQHLAQNFAAVLNLMEVDGNVESSFVNEQDNSQIDCSLLLNNLIVQVENDISDHSEMQPTDEANQDSIVDSLENKHTNAKTTNTEQNPLEEAKSGIMPPSNDRHCETQNVQKPEETQHLAQHCVAALAQMEIDGNVEKLLANEKDDCSLVLNSLIGRVENEISEQSEMQLTDETNQDHIVDSLENKYPHTNATTTEQNLEQSEDDGSDIMPTSNDPQCETQNVQKTVETQSLVLNSAATLAPIEIAGPSSFPETEQKSISDDEQQQSPTEDEVKSVLYENIDKVAQLLNTEQEYQMDLSEDPPTESSMSNYDFDLAALDEDDDSPMIIADADPLLSGLGNSDTEDDDNASNQREHHADNEIEEDNADSLRSLYFGIWDENEMNHFYEHNEEDRE